MPSGSENRQGAFHPGGGSLQPQPGDACVVVAVHVAHEHGVDRVRVDAELPQPHQGGSSAVHQEAMRVRLHAQAGLQASPAAEGVAAADEADADGVGGRSVTRAAARAVIRRAFALAQGPVVGYQRSSSSIVVNRSTRSLTGSPVTAAQHSA